MVCVAENIKWRYTINLSSIWYYLIEIHIVVEKKRFAWIPIQRMIALIVYVNLHIETYTAMWFIMFGVFYEHRWPAELPSTACWIARYWVHCIIIFSFTFSGHKNDSVWSNPEEVAPIWYIRPVYAVLVLVNGDTLMSFHTLSI